MAFIDELKIHIKAGRGGDGVVRWRHEKSKEFSGPSGGDGGDGGNVYVKAIRDFQALSRYRHVKELAAGRGQDGMRDSMHGKNGDDLEMELPVGCVITNQRNGRSWELTHDGQRELILEGGKGGRGNEQFKSSTNIRPEQSTPGKEGAEADFTIELLLGVDAGFIGFPNAGKSSLLNALTRARAKIGAYPFTTLEPNLGDLYGFVLGDIPGLIEGASEGKGLGHTFLRHIKKTKVLVHCISVEQPDVEEAYATIRNELGAYEESLLEKPEIIVLTKTDMVDDDKVKELKKLMEKTGKTIYTVTVLDNDKLKEFADNLIKCLRSFEQKEQ